MSANQKNKKNPTVVKTTTANRGEIVNPPLYRKELKNDSAIINYLKSDAVLMVLLSVITFLCYKYSLQNQFINWDDTTYIVGNPYIKSFSSENLTMLLFHCVTALNYHPLTMLSLAINYYFSGLNPESYYLTNIILHILNVLLVFLIAKKLFEGMQVAGYGNLIGIPFLAALCGLFFAIHPMHVESVSWIPERKDVLYTFFYFLGLLMYLKYEKRQTVSRMTPVVLFFVLSSLSKAMAVTFPLSLFAFDILLKRKFTRNLIVEKIPLLLISLFFGILAFSVQNKVNGVVFVLSMGYTFFLKLLVPFYALLVYAFKAFIPIHLACFYPLPDLTTGKTLPVLYYLAPVIDLGVTGILFYLCYKAGENYFRVAIFSVLFFVLNLAFVLQFLSVSYAVISERYTYVAYFGIFFSVVYFLGQLWSQHSHSHIPLLIFCACFGGFLFYQCYERTKVWHYDVTLWEDEIEKYPNHGLAYQQIANYYYTKNDTDDALKNYTQLVALGTNEPRSYCNLANIYSGRKKYETALSLYAIAIKIGRHNSEDCTYYLNRGNTYAMMGKFNLALNDYDSAYRFDADTNDLQLLHNRAFTCYSNNMYVPAVRDFTHIIRLHGANAFDYATCGWAEFRAGNAAAAAADCLQALKMEPGNTHVLYNLSLIYGSQKNYKDSYTYALKARQAGFQVDDVYMKELKHKAGE